MPDIQMRFHQDMLVLSAPLDATLRAQGIEDETAVDVMAVDEPETLLEAIRLQQAVGAPCLVAPTRAVTRARLAHLRLSDKASGVAQAALSVVRRLRPQHLLAELGPTGLPLDPTSKPSLTANRDQYADAAEAIGYDVDAVFLNGFSDPDDLLCALMGVRKASDVPLFASVVLDSDARMGGKSLAEVAEMVEEYEADVMGFATQRPPDAAAELVERACRATDLPILVQLNVAEGAYDAELNPYADADALVACAMRLRSAGAQFLQATGQARATHTGALAAATMGLDAIR